MMLGKVAIRCFMHYKKRSGVDRSGLRPGDRRSYPQCYGQDIDMVGLNSPMEGLWEVFLFANRTARSLRPLGDHCSYRQTQPVGLGKPPYLAMTFMGPVFQRSKSSFLLLPAYFMNLRSGGVVPCS